MNKLLSVIICLFYVQATMAAGDISEKILQLFSQTFPRADDVKWFEQPDKVTVNFKDDGIITKVEYDKDGNFVSSVRYYFEKNLPVNIICKLKERYKGKTVFGVTEMTTDSSVEYYIKLEDAKSWMTVRSTVDGNMEVTEKFNKTA